MEMKIMARFEDELMQWRHNARQRDYISGRAS